MLQAYLMMACTDSYAAAVKVLDGSPKSVEWEKWMEPIMEGGDGAAYDPNAAYPDGLSEVYRFEATAARRADKATTSTFIWGMLIGAITAVSFLRSLR